MSKLPLPRQLWIVRHGETEWSRSGQHTSFTEMTLTDHGREKAREVAPLLSSVEFCRVFSSPMERALETADLAGFPDPDLSEDLREWNYGSYEGVTTDVIRKEVPDWSIWSHGPPEDGETHEQVSSRADRFIEEVRGLGGAVLAFGHGHMMRVITARWLDLPAAEGKSFVLDAGAISVLGAEHEWPAIRTWNQIP